VQHVFVLMLENRSFDHLRGFSGITGADAATGAPTTIEGLTGAESNDFHDVTYRASPGAPNRMRQDPGHNFDAVLIQLAGYGATYPPGGPYPPIDNSGFATSYGLGEDRDPADVMRCCTEAQLPYLHQLAREFAVCDHWYASHPGHTWPNRVFLHAASSGGMDMEPDWTDIVRWTTLPGDGLELANGTIYDRLRDAGLAYRHYQDDDYLPPMVASLKGVSLWDIDDLGDLASDLADPDFRDVRLVHIEPSYDVFGIYPTTPGSYGNGNSQHPLGDVRRGDALIKRVYETIRNSPVWEHSLLIITWDEHGGFYDHVAPPLAVPPGDTPAKCVVNEHRFGFDQLGPRVPALLSRRSSPRTSSTTAPATTPPSWPPSNGCSGSTRSPSATATPTRCTPCSNCPRPARTRPPGCKRRPATRRRAGAPSRRPAPARRTGRSTKGRPPPSSTPPTPKTSSCPTQASTPRSEPASPPSEPTSRPSTTSATSPLEPPAPGRPTPTACLVL